MKNYGLAALVLVVGLALGVIIGLLAGDDGADERAELLATQTALRAAESERDEAVDQLGSTIAQLEATDQERMLIEEEVERLLSGGDPQELMGELNAAREESERLRQELQTSSEQTFSAQGAVTPHIFILQELFAFAENGFDGEGFAGDPAIEDGLDQLPADVATSIRDLFTETDAGVAAEVYPQVFQAVLNSLQAAVLG